MSANGRQSYRLVVVGVALLFMVGVVGCSPGPWGRVRVSEEPVSEDAAALARESRLGPDGFGKIKLGMTLDQFKNTGQVSMYQSGTARCRAGQVTGAGGFGGHVLVSPTFGAAEIDDYPGVRTPEGIGAGSAFADVKRAYPGLHEEKVDYPTGRYEEVTTRSVARVPTNPSAWYLFYFADNKVESMALVLGQQDCDPWSGEVHTLGLGNLNSGHRNEGMELQ